MASTNAGTRQNTVGYICYLLLEEPRSGKHMSVITNSVLTKEKLSTTLKKYVEALNWLDSKGFNIGPSRLKRYQTHYESLIHNWGNETILEIVTNKNYASAIYEAYEVIEIKDKLEEIECKEVYESLKKSLSGVELYSDELSIAKPSSARNFSFELYMARYFKRAGYDLNFNTIADFNAHNAEDSIFVECKRPAKEETVGKNIENALKQSMKRFIENDCRNQKGVAAIDLTALINPNLNFLVTDDINAVPAILKKSDNESSPEVKRHFDKYGEHCISVMFHWRVPVLHLKEETVGLYERCFSVPIFKSGTSSEEVFYRSNNELVRSVGL
ncbi:hypothetical protein D3C71_998690 [compost metagenome]